MATLVHALRRQKRGKKKKYGLQDHGERGVANVTNIEAL